MTVAAHRHRSPPSPPGAPLPLSIGPANAELCTGVPWRYLRDRYAHLLRDAGPGKRVILARDLEAALAGRDARDDATADLDSYRASLGIERVSP